MSASFLEEFQDEFCSTRTGLDGMSPTGSVFDQMSMDIAFQTEALRDGRIGGPGLFPGEDDLHPVGGHSLHASSEIDGLHSPNFGERSLDMRGHVVMMGDDMHNHPLLSHEIGDDMVGRSAPIAAATHVE